ncbi:MAG: collagen binding domain-containing protein [Thermoplasmata archaeon]
MRYKLISVCLLAVLVFSLITLAGPTAKAQEDSAENDMKFFLHYADENESARTLPGGGSTLTYFDTTTDWSDEKVVYNMTSSQANFDWYLYPSLKSDLTFSSFEFKIWARYVSGAAPTGDATIIVSEINETGETTWSQSFSQEEKEFTSTPELKVYDGNLSEPHTFQEGSSIKIRFHFNAGAGKTFEFYYDTSQMDSRVELMTPDSMEIESVSTLDSDHNHQAVFDPTSPDKDMFIRTTMTDPFGGYDIKWVNITLTGPSGELIFDNKSMNKVTGTPLTYRNEYEVNWNYSGYDPGRYNITIWAVDNNGYNHYTHFSKFNYGNYSDVSKTHFTIGENYYANIHVLSSSGTELERAEITAHLSGNYVDSALTDDEGYVNLTLIEGEYVFKVEWQDTIVLETEMTINQSYTYNESINITAEVYDPEFKIIDSHENPLENTAVYYVHPNESSPPEPLTTNESGYVSLDNMAGGEYRITVRWSGIEVADESLKVSSNEVIIIEADVYYANFKAVDSRDEPLQFVQIVVYDSTTGIVHDFNITNSTGESISRLPAGDFDIDVFWNDKIVNETDDLTITDDQEETLHCEVYYLNLKAVDSKDNELRDVHLRINDETGYLFGSGYTDDSGEASFQIANGTYILEGYWQDRLVYEDDQFEIGENKNQTLECDVYYLDLTAEDSKGKVISDANVRLEDETGITYGSSYTDDSGSVNFKVPKAVYTLSVNWQETEVYSNENYEVNEDRMESLSCNVYYLEVKTETSDGEKLSKVLVTVKDDQDNLYGSQYTNNSGKSEFRLPEGDYSITSRYKSTYYLSHIDMDEQKDISLQGSTSETVKFNQFPIPAYRTLAFLVILLSGIIVAALLAGFWYYTNKYAKSSEQEDEEVVEDTEKGTEDEKTLEPPYEEKNE